MQMPLEIVREPYLEQLRENVAELKRLADGNPNIIVVAQAWASFDKIKEALSQLCPNHPQIGLHF